MLIKRYKIMVIDEDLKNSLVSSGQKTSWIISANSLESAWNRFVKQNSSVSFTPNPTDYDISFFDTKSVGENRDIKELVEQYLFELDTTLDGLKVDADGTKRFYRFGKLQDPTGGAAVIYPDGSIEHWVGGKRHSEDEPAIKQADGDEWWYLNNKLHNTNGPAVTKDGNEEYWVNGVKLDYDTFMRKYGN